jgi:glycylpeptide N-tetradecanoyltransferase
MAKMEELGDSTQPEHNADDESSPEDGETNPREEQAFTASQTSQSHKKKKKSKALRALNALRGKEIPQEIVDSVLEKVKAEEQATGSPIASGADADSVRSALEQLKILEVLKGNTGIGGKNKKDMGEHKVSQYLLCAMKHLTNHACSSSGRRNPSHN